MPSVGKYGCLPAQFPGALKDLTYYAAGPLPTAPPSVAPPTPPTAVADASGPWGILGNDRYGDCGVAGLQHGFEADASATHESLAWPTDQQATEYYLHYTGGQDSGVVLSAYLNYVRQNKYYNNSVALFAPAQVNNIPVLQTGIYLYDFLYTGIAVTDVMEQEFGNGQAWDSAGASGTIVGGHCVPLIGYDDQYLYCITWGRVQPITYPAWHSIASEAWAVLTGELLARHGDGRGINVSALRQDLSRI